MDLDGLYFRDGFMRVAFDARRVDDIVARAMALGSGATHGWVSKYAGTQDLRPNPTTFDAGLVEALFDNDVPATLEAATMSRDLTLVHCQVRWVTTPPGASYMPWHRDTYIAGSGEWVGNHPPVHKVIVYVDDGDASERLAVVPGSHRLMYDEPDMDVGAYNRGNTRRIEVVRASNTEALLFNTALLHSVAPESSPRGSVRVIYSFATTRQYDVGYSHIDVHVETNTLYEALRVRSR